MKKSMSLLLVLLVSLVMFFSFSGVAFGLMKDSGTDENEVFQAQWDLGPGVTARCDQERVMPGDTFTVDFSVRNITGDGLYGASLDFKFDNSLVELVYGSNNEIVEMGALFADEISSIYLYPYLIKEAGRTIDDLNTAGHIDYVVMLSGNSPGIIMSNDDWHTFARITFRVKDNISFSGSPLKALDINITDDSDNMTNGTAVVKLANFSVESGDFPNRVTYTGINSRVNVIDPVGTAILGRVIDAESGEPIAGVSVSAYGEGSQTLAAVATSGPDGIYAFSQDQLTRGNIYNFSFTASGWGNMVDEGITVPSTGYEKILSCMFPALVDHQYRVVLKWDSWSTDYRELDAHMIVPPMNSGEDETDVYWNYTGNGQTYPYAKWMGDKDWLIESVVLTHTDIISGPYKFFVEDWDGMNFAELDAYVQVYDHTGLLNTVYLSDVGGSGSGWDVLIIENGIITVRNNLFEIKGFIKLALPSVIQEDDTLTATFDVPLYTERMDLTDLDPEAEINVNMWNSFGSYQGTYVPELSSDGNFIFRFSGVKAGHYKIEAWLRGAHDKGELFVDSYQSSPVIYRVSPWVIPSGYQHYGFGMDGYNLSTLSSNTIVELVYPDTGEVVASTVGSENWLGVYLWPENDYTHMDVQIKATEGRDTIPPGSYDVRITNTNWDWVTGKRYQQLVVSDQPALRGHIYPWVLGAGASEYSLEFEGINFDLLNNPSGSSLIKVELWNDDFSVLIDTDNDPEIVFQDIGQGWIKAIFSAHLPNYTTWVHPVVRYIADDTIIPSDEFFSVEVVDYPKVYGLENNRVIPGKTSYDLLIKGWNLDIGKTYTLEVYGKTGLIKVLTAQPVSSTDMPFTLTGTSGWSKGGYDIQVIEKEGGENKHFLGGAWLEVQPADVFIEPNSLPEGYADRTITLSEPGNMDIWKTGDPITIQIMNQVISDAPVSNINVTENTITFTLFSGLPQNGYYLEVMRDGFPIAKSWFTVNSEPTVTIDYPSETLQEGDTFNTTFNLTIKTNNIDLSDLDYNKDLRVEMWSEFRHYTGDCISGPEDDGSFVFKFTDVEAGNYVVDAWVKNTYGRLEPIWVFSYDYQPIIYQARPSVHPTGNNYLGFDLAGYNLMPLSSDSILELIDNQGTEPVVVATTDGDEEWLGVTYHQRNYHDKYLRVTMKAAEGGIPAGFYTLRIYDPGNPDLYQQGIGLRLDQLEFTQEARLHGVEPNHLGVGAESYYIKLHGINLDQLNISQLSVELKDSDNTSIALADNTQFVSNEGGFGYLLAEFSTSLPAESQNIQVVANHNGVTIPGGENIWIWLTDKPVFTDIEPATVICGKDSYSFNLKGYNLNKLEGFWMMVSGPGNTGGPRNPSFEVLNGSLNFTLDLDYPLPLGDYELLIYDQYPSTMSEPMGSVRFKLEPGRISLPVTSLTEGYADTELTVTDISDIGDIWDEGEEDIIIKIMKSDAHGVPQGEANVKVTSITVLEDDIRFTLPAGLGEGYYLIEVYRGDEIMVGKGTGFEVKRSGVVDTTGPIIDGFSPANGTTINIPNPTIGFIAYDDESRIDSLSVFIDSVDKTNDFQVAGILYTYQAEGLSEGMHNVYVHALNGERIPTVASWSFNVELPSIVSAVYIIPDNPNVLPNGTVQFSVLAKDQRGNPISLPTGTNVEWSIISGANKGSIDADTGLLTAGSGVGTIVVQVAVGDTESGRLYDTVLVNIADIPIVSLNMENDIVSLGSEFNVSLEVSNISALHTAQFYLTFDPQKLEVVDSIPGTFAPGINLLPGEVFSEDRVIGEDGQIQIQENTANNTVGSISFTATMFGTPGTDVVPFTGSGNIATIKFRAKEDGLTEIVFTHQTATPGGAVLVTWDNGQVSLGLDDFIRQNCQVEIASTATAVGTIKLEGVIGNKHYGIKVIMRNQITDEEYYSTCLEDGAFSITGMPEGTYTFIAEQKGYLRMVQKNIAVQAGNSVNINQIAEVTTIILRAGDINGDKVVNALDLSIFGPTWKKSAEQNGFVAEADFNRDGVINALDLSLFGPNWKKAVE